MRWMRGEGKEVFGKENEGLRGLIMSGKKKRVFGVEA